MELEIGQLDLRYAGLRITTTSHRARLVASLAEHGQQSAVLVVPACDQRYVLVDGYARVDALRELGRDLVDAVVLDVPEPEALVLAWRLESRRRRSALEEGWMIAELIRRHALDQRQVAERLQRSVSWVSRRLALVQQLPSVAQEAVKRGVIPAYAATKYLVPLARAKSDHCERLVSALGDKPPLSVRQVERLYLGWRRADEATRERIVHQPRLYLQTEAALEPEPAVPDDDPAAPLLGDLEGIAGLSRRGRRRLREGILHELDEHRRSLVARSSQESRLAFEGLTDLLKEGLCSISTPAQPS